MSKAFEVLKVAEVMHRVLLCMLEAVDGELCLLEVLESIRCMRLSTLEGRLCFGVSKFPNCVVRCGSFCLQSSVVTSVRLFCGNDLKAIFRVGTQPRERRKKLACYSLREGNVCTRLCEGGWKDKGGGWQNPFVRCVRGTRKAG